MGQPIKADRRPPIRCSPKFGKYGRYRENCARCVLGLRIALDTRSRGRGLSADKA
jgi:hypothetical protein